MLPQIAVDRFAAPTTTRRPLPMLSPHLLAILALIAANIVWGTTFVATKPILDRVPPITLASARFAIALLVLIPLLSLTGRRPVLNRRTALMGFVGVFVVYAFQNLGLAFTEATNGAIIHGGIPVFTMLLAAPFLGERLGLGKVTGLLLSLMGVAAVVLRTGSEPLGMSALGDGLVLLSGFGLAAYFVLVRRFFPGQDSIEIVGGVAVFGSIFMLPASGIEIWMQGVAMPTTSDLIGLVYLGAFASALAFVLWGYGLRHLEAGQASAFANLNPLVGVVFAALLLGESITLLQVAGGALILSGVWLANRPAAAPRPAATPARLPQPGRAALAAQAS